MSTRKPKRPSPSTSFDSFLQAGGHNPLSSSSSSAHKDKKPRFDIRNPSTLAPDVDDTANDNDNVLGLDEIGVKGRRFKRNAVNIEGYESDSSNDGYQREISLKKKRMKELQAGNGGSGVGNEGEDEDMFASEQDNDLDSEIGKEKERAKEEDSNNKKKEVRFLELDDIKGQEFDSKSEDDNDDDTSSSSSSENESEEEDEEDEGEGEGVGEEAGDEKFGNGEDDGVTKQKKQKKKKDKFRIIDEEEVGAGGRKKHAPKLDAFNMKSEMEEGRFDEAGNFIRKAKDVDAIHDSWLEGVSKKDIKKAKAAMEKREKERVEKMKQDDKIITTNVLSDLIACLDKGESPLEALARLGGGKKKKWNINKNTRWRKRGNEISRMDVDVPIGDGEHDDAEEEAEEDVADRKRKEMVEKITGAADILFTRGQIDVYDDTREMLMRQYKRETGEDWVDPGPPGDEASNTAKEEGKGKEPAETKWEYRWMNSEDDRTYGPFGSAEMKAWNTHGFFRSGVEFRKVGTPRWTMVADFGDE